MRPNARFNWMQVSWGAPDQIRTETCSYCDAPIDDESVPLIIWRADGWVGEFCEECQRQWWGMQSFRVVLAAHESEDEPEPQALPACMRHPGKLCPGECQYLLSASECIHDAGPA